MRKPDESGWVRILATNVRPGDLLLYEHDPALVLGVSYAHRFEFVAYDKPFYVMHTDFYLLSFNNKVGFAQTTRVTASEVMVVKHKR